MIIESDLSFPLLTKLNCYDLLIHGMFCDLGIVSRVTFTSGCAALSHVQSFTKIHCIWGREAQRKRGVNTLIFFLLSSFNNFATVSMDYSPVLSFVMHFAFCFFVELCFHSSAKKGFIKMFLYLSRTCSFVPNLLAYEENDPVVFCQMVCCVFLADYVFYLRIL